MTDDTQFSKARIEMLCDGVFAIAMTLLVLELKVPELPKQTPTAELWHALGELNLLFLMFVSLLPFTTSLYARFGAPAGIPFYFGHQFILSLLVWAQWILASRTGLLGGDARDPKRVRFVAVLAAFTTMLGSLFAVSIVAPGAAGLGALPGAIAVLFIRRRAEKRARAALA